MHLSHLFQRSVSMYGERPALAVAGSPSVSYADLSRQISALAYWMRHSLGLEAGDRITLAMANSVEYAQAMLAAWHAGLCTVPINNKLHPNEIDYILRDSGSRACLTDSSLYDRLLPVTDAIEGMALIDVGASDYSEALGESLLMGSDGAAGQSSETPAWLFYTSGTTGRPKGVILTHANLANMALNFYADVQPVCESDALLHVAPMSHGSGLYSVPYFIKGALQLIPASGSFNEAELCQVMQSHQNVSLFAAPTMVQRLVKHIAAHPTTLPGLKCMVVAGAPFYIEDIKAAVHAIGPRIAQIYGQGESPMSITAQTASQIARAVEQNDKDLLGSVGYAQTSIEVRIEDGNGNSLSADELGEVMVCGPTVMHGYWGNPQTTESTLVKGWLRTGDVGVLDARGLLHLKDRSKDVIISGGTNIYPREVEEALMQHPNVAEVSVIGMPDPGWGETVLAFVVCQKEAGEIAPADLDALCLTQIARFKRPKRYIFIEELPKNATGKVLKRQLQKLIPRS
ncbi:AMP-binding protein [Eoetvoesiella caeni]